MLFLNEQAMRQAVTLPQVMDQVENAYRQFAAGDFYMPERPMFKIGNNAVLYMPCFTSAYFGTKILYQFVDNPKQGLPYIDGLMLLNDSTTGKTLAIMDGGFLTALRTGAVGGVGMRCFSPLTADSIGIVGAGRQGFYQAVYSCYARPIRDIYLFDAYKPDLRAYADALAVELKEKRPRIHICRDIKELVEHSRIIVTTTPSREPVLPDDEQLLKGKCLIAIGSHTPQMRELPDAVWRLVDHVYTELPFAMEESGDLSQPLAAQLLTPDHIRYIGDLLIAGGHTESLAVDGTTCFKSVGMALLDLNVAWLIYQSAISQGLGQMLFS